MIIGDADYHAEKVDMITPPESWVNYITLTGNLTDVRVLSGEKCMSNAEELFNVPAGDRFFYGSRITATRGATFRIPFTERYGTPEGFNGDLNLPVSGDKRIHGVELYHVSTSESVPADETLPLSLCRGGLDSRWAFALKSLAASGERRCIIADGAVSGNKRTIYDIGAFRRLNIMTEPFDEETGLASVTLSLPVRAASEGEALFVRVHDPAVPSRIWNHFALNLKGFNGSFGILTLVIDFTDLVLTGGDRLWIDIGTAGKCEIALGESSRRASLSLERVPAFVAIDAYSDKEIVPAQAQYSKMYEFMPWNFTGRTVTLEEPYSFGGPFDMLYPALAVRRVNPGHFVASFIERFCTNVYDQHGRPADKDAIRPVIPDNPHGAPEWALYLREFNRFRERIATWMADHLNPDGQLGGGWNDDSLLIGFHMPDLMFDGNDAARTVADSVHAGLDRTRLFAGGYCNVTPIDRFHVGDFIVYRYNTVPANLGQAFPLEREMEAAWHHGRPDRTPVNYGEGEAFSNAVSILKWYWGEDWPEEHYASKPLSDVARDLRGYLSEHDEYTYYRFTDAYVHRDDNAPYGSYQVYPFMTGSPRPPRWNARLSLAVMWPSGGGAEMARVVRSADDTSLTVSCYSFDKRTRELIMRLCRIRDGRYRIALYDDPSGDGSRGAMLWEDERDLRRFDTVPVPIPPGKPVIIDVEQTEEHARPSRLPDLAIDPWEARLDGSTVTVTVHNLGNESAHDIIVRLLDGDKTIGEKTIAQIHAPTDYVAKCETVTFSGVTGSRNLRIVIDPDDTIDEILEENNIVNVNIE